PAEATSGYAKHSWNAHGPPPANAMATWQPSSGASPDASARKSPPGSRALHPGDRLASAAQQRHLHRPRRRLVHPKNRQQHPPPRPPHHRAPRHGIPRQPREGSLLIAVKKILTGGGLRTAGFV